jgi:hypothetical protein
VGCRDDRVCIQSTDRAAKTVSACEEMYHVIFRDLTGGEYDDCVLKRSAL